MWYVVLNDRILPTPYQYMRQATDECRRLKKEMVAVMTDVVYLDD